jgi:hypothetical protein
MLSRLEGSDDLPRVSDLIARFDRSGGGGAGFLAEARRQRRLLFGDRSPFVLDLVYQQGLLRPRNVTASRAPRHYAQSWTLPPAFSQLSRRHRQMSQGLLHMPVQQQQQQQQQQRWSSRAAAAPSPQMLTMDWLEPPAIEMPEMLRMEFEPESLTMDIEPEPQPMWREPRASPAGSLYEDTASEDEEESYLPTTMAASTEEPLPWETLVRWRRQELEQLRARGR